MNEQLVKQIKKWMAKARTGDTFARGIIIVVSYFHYNFEIKINELKNLGIGLTHLYVFLRFFKRNSHYILLLCMQILQILQCSSSVQ